MRPQRLMNQVLRGLTYEQCLVYLDDILIFSTDFDSHLTDIAAVMERIRKAGLKLKPTKCSFGRAEVDYLGHTVSARGIAVQQKKVQAVQEFPVPVAELSQFSWVYYRRFMAGFSALAGPLNGLLKKGSGPQSANEDSTS